MRRLFLMVFALVLCGGFLELASRAVHGGKAPLLPYYFRADAAMLPADYDAKTSFYGRPANRYTTDDWGARIADRSLAHQRLSSGVIALGDSQMLGYMLDFPQTFASLVAGRLTGDPKKARMLAAPANHLGTLRAMVRNYAGSKLGHQRLLIVGLNLGNDLDEMYADANWSRHDTGPFERFMMVHSFVYMDYVLIKSHWLAPGEEPPGINPILYMLNPSERTVLAREAVRVLVDVLNDPALDADQKIVVIVPSDYQVDPKEFLKYRRYYRSQTEFDRWNDQIQAFAAMMNALEQYMAKQLEDAGWRVVRFSTVAAAAKPEARMFDDSSHHLTAVSHRLLANAIVDALK